MGVQNILGVGVPNILGGCKIYPADTQLGDTKYPVTPKMSTVDTPSTLQARRGLPQDPVG